MKTMTCKQLGGACDTEFHANSFEEMAELSKKHGMEMFQKGDKDHQLLKKSSNYLSSPRRMHFVNKTRFHLF